MKIISDETRQRMSDSAKKRCTAEWRQKKSALYSTPIDTEKVREMYNAGMTQTEIANKLNVSQKVIWKHMKNHGIRARKAAKRNQIGSMNHMWKGNNASYKAFHLRIKTIKGKASNYGCAICGRTDKDAFYDWANLTGRYEDINDYKPMCRKCHRQYDKQRKQEVMTCQS